MSDPTGPAVRRRGGTRRRRWRSRVIPSAFFVYGGFLVALAALGARTLARPVRFNAVTWLGSVILLYSLANFLFVRPLHAPPDTFDVWQFVRWHARELSLVLCAVLMAALRHPAGSYERAEAAVVGAGGLFALLGVLEYVARHFLGLPFGPGLVELDPSGSYFFKAYLDAHNAAGGLYLLVSVLALWGAVERRLSPVWLPLCVVGLFLTGSRTAVLSFVFAAAVSMTFLLFTRTVRALTLGLILTVLAAPSAGVVVSRLLPLFQGNVDANTSSRFLLWRQAWDAFTSHPWFGVGWGNYGFYDADLYARGWSTHAHNSFLQLLAEGGVVGFALYSFLFVLLGYGLLRRRAYPLLIALAAVLASSVYEHNLGAPTIVVPLVCLIGLRVFSVGRHATTPDQRPHAHG